MKDQTKDGPGINAAVFAGRRRPAGRLIVAIAGQRWKQETGQNTHTATQ